MAFGFTGSFWGNKQPAGNAHYRAEGLGLRWALRSRLLCFPHGCRGTEP